MDLLSVDSATGKVYRHSGLSPTVLIELSIPGGVHGAAWDGTNLITNTYDAGLSTVVKRFSGFSNVLLGQFNALCGGPAWGLGWDGENVITAEASGTPYNQGCCLTQWSGFSNIVRQRVYVSGAALPTDVFPFEGNTYVLLQYGVALKLSGFSSTILSQVYLPSGIYTGLAVVDGDLVVCRSDNRTVYVFNGFSNALKTSFLSPGTEPLDLSAGTFAGVPGAQRVTSRRILI